jgi:hypothetical protein
VVVVVVFQVKSGMQERLGGLEWDKTPRR